MGRPVGTWTISQNGTSGAFIKGSASTSMFNGTVLIQPFVRLVPPPRPAGARKVVTRLRQTRQPLLNIKKPTRPVIQTSYADALIKPEPSANHERFLEPSIWF